MSYDFFYKNRHHLSENHVQSFLVCAKTPRSKVLEKFAYKQSEHKGVYTSQMPVFRWVMLIILNDLSDEAHNAWIKCFASRPKEKKKAFVLLKNFFSFGLERFLSGLWNLWFEKMGEQKMNIEDIEITPEAVMRMGALWGDSYLAGLNAEERLAGLNTEDLLAKLNTEERLSGLNTEDLLARLSVEEIERYLQKRK